MLNAVVEVNSTEFYVMALTVAMALVALLFGQRKRGAATTEVVAFTLNDCVTHDDGLVVMQAMDDHSVLVLRNGMPVCDGDTVNLVVTAIDDKLTIIEKKGIDTRSGLETRADGTAMISYLPAGLFHVRYESELTGQWALFSFSNHPGRTASSHLKL